MRSWLVAGVGLGVTAGAALAQDPVPPPLVAAKIAALDRACGAAGGRQVRQPYVFVHDFTGDGRNDFLVSEGNYNCAGRPELFRRDNTAVVEIYVSDERGGASLAFRERLLAYRILDARPRVVQIARGGAACGPNAAPTAQCGATLGWNAAARQFAATPTGTRNGPAVPAAPPTGVAQAPTQPPAPAASPTAAAPVLETQAQFAARCRRETLAENPDAARWVDEECKQIWGRTQASKPMVDAALALIPEAGPPPRDVAGVKARLPAVRWTARPEGTQLAGGKLGALDVGAEGKGQVDQVTFWWDAIGQFPPYDVPQALKARGASLTMVACTQLGGGENSKTYRVNAPGKPPFGLTVYDRAAPTASATAFYNVTVDMSGRAPTLASVRASGATDAAARCPP